eukprot:2630992-Rhodomonas_salina.4
MTTSVALDVSNAELRHSTLPIEGSRRLLHRHQSIAHRPTQTGAERGWHGPAAPVIRHEGVSDAPVGRATRCSQHLKAGAEFAGVAAEQDSTHQPRRPGELPTQRAARQQECPETARCRQHARWTSHRRQPRAPAVRLVRDSSSFSAAGELEAPLRSRFGLWRMPSARGDGGGGGGNRISSSRYSGSDVSPPNLPPDTWTGPVRAGFDSSRRCVSTLLGSREVSSGKQTGGGRCNGNDAATGLE